MEKIKLILQNKGLRLPSTPLTPLDSWSGHLRTLERGRNYKILFISSNLKNNMVWLVTDFTPVRQEGHSNNL